MTNPSRFFPSSTLRVRPTSGVLAFLFTILSVSVPMSLLAGCEKKKPPPVVEAPPPPPPPVPDPVQVDPIMQSMSPSAKVQFPQFAAPHSDGLARAVIAFADALAKGDATKFGSMLNPVTAKPLLTQLMNDGAWDTSVAEIEAVRVVLVNDDVNPNADAAAVYFAVQATDGAYLLGWGAAKVGDEWKFAGAPASDLVKRRASDWDNLNILALMSDAPAATNTTEIAEPEAPAATPAAPASDAPAPAPGDAPPSNPTKPGSGG